MTMNLSSLFRYVNSEHRVSLNQVDWETTVHAYCKIMSRYKSFVRLIEDNGLRKGRL